MRNEEGTRLLRTNPVGNSPFTFLYHRKSLKEAYSLNEVKFSWFRKIFDLDFLTFVSELFTSVNYLKNTEKTFICKSLHSNSR